MKIKEKDLSDIISKQSYQNTGDSYERKFFAHLDTFENHESFWKRFIVPSTERIEGDFNKIASRNGVSEKIQVLFSMHYTTFLNIVYAKESLINKQLSYFENFYAHLGSCCDVAEEFLTETYLLYNACTSKETKILQSLSKNEFLQKAGQWYDVYYSNAYEYYLSKGKVQPMKLISRSNILQEYYGDKNPELIAYIKVSQRIKTFRNVIVHNTQIGKLIIGNKPFVPKSIKILDYKTWPLIFNVAKDQNKISNDFIEMESQMEIDLKDLKQSLNAIWTKANETFNILWKDKNPELFKMYNLEIE